MANWRTALVSWFHFSEGPGKSSPAVLNPQLFVSVAYIKYFTFLILCGLKSTFSSSIWIGDHHSVLPRLTLKPGSNF